MLFISLYELPYYEKNIRFQIGVIISWKSYRFVKYYYFTKYVKDVSI